MINKTKRPTIKDIAKMAGVTHATVSHALRDNPCVKAETREKIKSIAHDIGYTPNIYARNLALRKPTSIGVIVPSIQVYAAYNEVINSLSELSAKANLCLVLGSCNGNIELEANYCKLMCQNMVGAIIIASCTGNVEHINKICDGIVPVIYISEKTKDTEKNYILPDFYYSGVLAVEHLIELGHKDIRFFTYYPHTTSVSTKIKGYKDTMEKHNLTPHILRNGDSSDAFKSGYELINELINDNNIPTGIYCTDDLMAYGVIQGLKDHGLTAGKEISVIGHDNMKTPEIKTCNLTTIAIPKESIAELSLEYAQKLMAYNTKPDAPKPYCRSKLKTNLIVRNTTGRCII